MDDQSKTLESSGRELGQPADPTKALIEWGFAGLTQRYMTGVDESTPAGKLQVMQLINNRGESIEPHLNMELEVVNYLMTPALFADEETGEEVATIVTKLLLKGGKVVETHSKGIAKSIMTVLHFAPSPPWNPPMKCVPKRQQLRGKKSWIVLDVLAESLLAKKGGK